MAANKTKKIEPYWTLVKEITKLTDIIEHYNKLQPGSYVADGLYVADHLSYLNAKRQRYIQATMVLDHNGMGVK